MLRLVDLTKMYPGHIAHRVPRRPCQDGRGQETSFLALCPVVCVNRILNRKSSSYGVCIYNQLHQNDTHLGARRCTRPSVTHLNFITADRLPHSPRHLPPHRVRGVLVRFLVSCVRLALKSDTLTHTYTHTPISVAALEWPGCSIILLTQTAINHFSFHLTLLMNGL